MQNEKTTATRIPDAVLKYALKSEILSPLATPLPQME